MTALKVLQIIIGAAFLFAGLFFLVTAVVGTFKFKFCLNRLHAAAIGDTLASLLILTGVAILTGFAFSSLKIFLLLVLFWIGCPVTSHLLVRLELSTDDDVKKECEAIEE